MFASTSLIWAVSDSVAPSLRRRAGITVTLPKPQTSSAQAQGRFAKQDFRYLVDADAYLCPVGERLTYRFTSEQHGRILRRYWTTACATCAIKHRCTPGKERRAFLHTNDPRATYGDEVYGRQEYRNSEIPGCVPPRGVRALVFGRVRG